MLNATQLACQRHSRQNAGLLCSPLVSSDTRCRIYCYSKTSHFTLGKIWQPTSEVSCASLHDAMFEGHSFQRPHPVPPLCRCGGQSAPSQGVLH